MLETFLRGPKVTVHGYNAAIVNATFEDIADQSALVVQPTTAVALEVASSDANDTSAGTGARTVRVYGLNGSYVFQTEDFTMNGQTIVAGTKTWLFVWGAEVLTAGSGGVNAGTIYVADAAVTWAAGVPTGGGALTKTFAAITIGHNNSHAGYYCIPDGERYCLTKVIISNRAQIVDYHLKVSPYGSIPTRIVLGLLPATAPYEEIEFPYGAIILNEADQLTFQGSAASTGGIGSVIATLTRMARNA